MIFTWYLYTLLAAFIVAGVAALVCGVLLAKGLVRPGYLTGWSALGNLCTSMCILLWFADSLLWPPSVQAHWPPMVVRLVVLLPWCLLIAAFILQGRGFRQHRKLRHAGCGALDEMPNQPLQPTGRGAARSTSRASRAAARG